MKPITREWVEKAEADFATAQREIRVRKQPNYDGVCFHCQQSIEKYLKARLQEDRIVFTKTHNLLTLFDLLRSSYQTWNVFSPDLLILNNFAVAYRSWRVKRLADCARCFGAVQAHSRSCEKITWA
jgi:HEPN domain-containing protein